VKITRYLAGAVAGVVLGASSLAAQSIEFKGTTTGCFLSSGINYPDCNSFSSVGFDRSMVFFGGSFDQWTTSGNPGTVSIGDAAHASSNFGWFQLYDAPDTYTGDIFKLAINFADPTNVTPGAVFQAVMYGQVDRRGNGGVYIDFGGPQTFSFSGPVYSGSFSLALNDVMLSPADGIFDPYVAITGTATTTIGNGNVTATPEPGTTALLATGFIGLIPMIRRRNKKSQNV
jgi:hypothetical protein